MFAFTRGNEHVEEPPQEKQGILELVDTYTLPNTGRGVSFTSDNAYIAVSHAAGIAPNDTQVTLLKLANDELSYADSYKEGANVWSVAFHPGGEYIVCMRDGLTHTLILQRTGDSLSYVRRLSSPYGTDGVYVEFIDEDYFINTIFAKNTHLYYWNSGNPSLKDTKPLDSYPNQFGTNENYIVHSIAGSGSYDARVAIFKQEGDSLTQITEGMVNSKYSNSFGASFNNDRSVVVVSNGADAYELVVLSFDGSNLVVENEYASVVESMPTQVRITPDGKFVAVNHYSSPYLSLFKLSGYELTRTSTYTLPGRAINIRFSPDGEYLGVAHYGSPYFTLLRIV